MKKLLPTLLTLSAIMLVSQPAAAHDIKVIDSTDGEAVAGAVVISGKGLIIGPTDTAGSISVNMPTDLPLTFNCMGYQSIVVSEPTDTVRLNAAGINLPEVTVALDRPVKGVICFAREYCSSATSTDTMQYYGEYMLEAFVADEKVKGYKKSDASLKIKNARRYARFRNSSGMDSIAVPDKNDDVALLSFITPTSLSTLTFQEPEAIRNGASTVIVNGKYGPEKIYRKTDNVYAVRADALADRKDHHWEPAFFKLLGMTVDFQNFDISYAYAANESGKYDVTDLICQSESLHLLCKGRLLKKFFHTSDPVDFDCLIEIYPVDIVYYTVDAYKNRKKNRDQISFSKPESVQPLSPAVANLVSRIDEAFPER